MKKSITIIVGLFSTASAFQLPSSLYRSPTIVGSLNSHDEKRAHEQQTSIDGDIDTTSRRAFMENVASTSIGISLATLLSSSSPAYASGGATAGGVYLLSAKQRYNERVTKGVKSFLSLDGDIEKVSAYFETSDVGGWEDLSAAGYLLSNAFRTSSTKPPDSLPSVKKWKSFAKKIELLQRALAKKDSGKVLAAYNAAEEELDAYLDAVELPSGMELKQL